MGGSIFLLGDLLASGPPPMSPSKKTAIASDHLPKSAGFCYLWLEEFLIRRSRIQSKARPKRERKRREREEKEEKEEEKENGETELEKKGGERGGGEEKENEEKELEKESD